MEYREKLASYLRLTEVQLALALCFAGILAAVPKFFAPRIWDLSKKRLVRSV